MSLSAGSRSNAQAIGWDPDLNDGVRLNIRPFMRADLRKGGRAGAGILRWKPNIKWDKDRGKEPGEPRPREHFPLVLGVPGQRECNGSDRLQCTGRSPVRRQPLERSALHEGFESGGPAERAPRATTVTPSSSAPIDPVPSRVPLEDPGEVSATAIPARKPPDDPEIPLMPSNP